MNAPQTYQDAIDHFGLNWQVGLRPLYAQVGGDHGSQLITTNNAIVREDTGQVLAVVGDRYTPHQNNDANVGGIMDLVAAQTGAKYTAGGALDGGSKLWLTLELPEVITVKGNKKDIIKKYVLFRNSHDGSSAIVLGPTNLRLFCTNQFRMVEEQNKRRKLASQYNVRHTTNSESRIKQVGDFLEGYFEYQAALEGEINWMAETKFSDKQMDTLTHKLFNVDKKEEETEISKRTLNQMGIMRALFEGGQGILPENRGTAWAAYNAATEYYNHHMGMRSGNEHKRQASNLFGRADGLILDVLPAIKQVVAEVVG